MMIRMINDAGKERQASEKLAGVKQGVNKKIENCTDYVFPEALWRY